MYCTCVWVCECVCVLCGRVFRSHIAIQPTTTLTAALRHHMTRMCRFHSRHVLEEDIETVGRHCSHASYNSTRGLPLYESVYQPRGIATNTSSSPLIVLLFCVLNVQPEKKTKTNKDTKQQQYRVCVCVCWTQCSTGGGKKTKDTKQQQYRVCVCVCVLNSVNRTM